MVNEHSHSLYLNMFDVPSFGVQIACSLDNTASLNNRSIFYITSITIIPYCNLDIFLCHGFTFAS